MMRSERGAVLVEMAMVMPILTVLFLGVIQFGLVLREHQIVQNAAREGARLSMLPQYQCANDSSTNNATLTAVGNDVVQYLGQENITVTLGSWTTTPGSICPSATGGTATLSGTGISNGSITIDQNDTLTLSDGTLIGASKVTVTYSKNPVVGGTFFGAFTYTGTAVFRNLY
jgi:Flp pilus assembly protein TadG